MEDQQFGPDVYDLSLHKINGAKDIGYMENMLRAHIFAATTLGRRLDRHHFAHLHRMCVSYLGERQSQYNPSVRELWHPRGWSDDDIYHGIDPRHLRIVKFSGFEALAMNYALFSEPERFRKAYPLFAEVVEKESGELAVTRDSLNREFVRFQVCYFDRPYDGVDIAEKIDARFEEFYTTVAPLDARRRELARQVSRGGPDEAARTALNDMQKAILLEISRLHRWCEYLRPFNEGNTRFSILILNKLLVEYGFSLSITAQRNDVLFRSDRGWCAYIIEGMQRAAAIQQFGALGLLDHILAMRPEKYRRQRITMPAF